MAARRSAAARASAAPARVDPVESDEHLEPRRSTGPCPTTDGRWNAGPFEPAGIGLVGGRPERVDRSKLNQPANAGVRRADQLRSDGQGAHPLGAEQPLLGRRSRRHRRRSPSKSTGIAPALWAPSIDEERAAAVGELGDAPRSAGPRRSSTGRARPTTSRVRGRDRRLDRSQRPRVVAAVARRRRSRPRRRGPGARRADRGRPACSRRVVTMPVARAASRWQRDGVDAVGRGVGQRDGRRVGRQHGGHRGACLGHPLEHLGDASTWPRPSSSSHAAKSAMAAADLGGQRPDRAGVEVDARAERRQRLADGRQPLRVGQEGGDHGPYDTDDEWPGPTRAPGHDGVAGRAAGPAGRPRRRRALAPDGSGPAVYATGHIPGAVHLDWRADLIEAATRRRVAPARRPGADGGGGRRGSGSATARRSSSTTTARACSRPASGGACGPTASSRCGSSTAASRAWVEEGRPVSNAQVHAARRHASRCAARTGCG